MMKKNTMIRTYSELSKLSTRKERFEYLKLEGMVGEETFGWDRCLNQALYKDKRWLAVRDEVIIRDMGCDLGLEGYEIPDGVRIIVHHMNPITKEDLLYRINDVLNPEYLITVTKRTHDAIHYGSIDPVQNTQVIRSKNDTCPWRKEKLDGLVD